MKTTILLIFKQTTILLEKAVLLIGLLTLVACGGSDNLPVIPGVNNNHKSEQYNYNFTLNGCNTGSHSFSSLKAMCDGLANNSMNNFCAESMRCQKFQSDCANVNTHWSCN